MWNFKFLGILPFEKIKILVFWTLIFNFYFLQYVENSFNIICRSSLDPSTNKTDRYDITEILLKVALNTITRHLSLSLMRNCFTMTIQDVFNRDHGLYINDMIVIVWFYTTFKNISVISWLSVSGIHGQFAEFLKVIPVHIFSDRNWTLDR